MALADNTSQTPDDKWESLYIVGACLSGLATFVIVWLYALSEWGLLLGLVFGWIPAFIAAFIIGLIWPLLALLFVVFAVNWLNAG